MIAFPLVIIVLGLLLARQVQRQRMIAAARAAATDDSWWLRALAAPDMKDAEVFAVLDQPLTSAFWRVYDLLMDRRAWAFGAYKATHLPSGLELWIANGQDYLHPWRPIEAPRDFFNAKERHVLWEIITEMRKS